MSQGVNKIFKLTRRLRQKANRFLTNVFKPIKRLKKRYNLHLPSFTKNPIIQSIFVALFIVIIGLAYNAYHHTQLYKIDSKAAALLSSVSIDKNLIKESKTSFQYNRTVEVKANKELSQVIAAAKADSTGKLPYSAELAKDPKKGITFADSKGERAVTLTPTFDLSVGQLQEGRVIYPANTNERHSFTLKRNGLKEDILITKKPSKNIQTFAWKLSLDTSLEARMMPGGEVGIYSADPVLYGDIQITDAKSQALIDKARQNGERNFLVYEIPKPYITNARGNKNYDDLDFKLKNNILSLTARNLRNQTYPLSIDPTIVVTTTSDFQQNTGDTGNIDTATADQIGRGTIGSGAVGTTTQQAAAFTTARYYHTSVAYNGYLYIIGGQDASSVYQNDIQYCPINANGSVGTCTQQTAAFTTARKLHTSVVYNGYLYIISGQTSPFVDQNDIQYCPINANGSVGTCTRQTAAFTAAREAFTSVTYNGYLYIIGGIHQTSDTACNGTASFYCTDIQYCPINANGSVGTCTQQINAYTTARRYHTSVAYNGYLYIIGGLDSGSGPLNDIQYCPINANGSVGTCTQQTNAFTNVRSDHTSVVYNGYLYIIGGTGYYDDVQYCPINANGSVGTCTRQTAAFTTARAAHTSVVYNGYLYIIGGWNGTNYYNDIQYLPIGQGRASPATQQAAAYTTVRYAHTSVAYNGYMYIIGGCSASAGACSTQQNDVQYLPINSDGSVGTSVATTSFTTARAGHTSVAYNGYLYIIGGCSAGITITSCTTYLSDVQYAFICDGTATGGCTAGSTNVGKVGTWSATSSFMIARQSHTSVVYNGFIYVIGGDHTNPDKACDANFSTRCSDIEFAPINSNGTIGTWQYTYNSTISTTYVPGTTGGFTSARTSHTSVVYNGYLYIIGGDTSSYSNDIQYCPLNANGSVGTCTQQAAAFTTARYSHTSVAWGGYLYITGGWNGGFLNDIQYCPINANGSVGTCTQQTAAFTTARYEHASVAYNGYLYISGGCSGGSNCSTANTLNDIQRVRIAAGNSGVGATTQQAAAFTSARYGHTSIVYNGYLYIIGGCIDNTTCLVLQNDIQYCPINANGSVGTCTQQATAFNTVRYFHTSVVYNGYLYITGGVNNSLTNFNDILYAWLDPATGAACLPSNHATCTGTVFTQQAAAFTTPRADHSSVAYNGYLYIIGGEVTNTSSRLNDIQYCPLNANGSVGTCSQQNNAFTNTRKDHTSVVYNGYLYIIGGVDAGVVYLNDIQYCPLNANGSVGTCTQQTAAFTTGRSQHTSVAYNGYLYIAGGLNGSTNYNDIQYCPLNANGSVGNCTQQAAAFTTVRRAHTSVVWGGYLYIIGGWNGAANNSDIQRVATSPVLDVARYERTIDTGAAGNIFNTFVINGTAKCSYTVLYKTAGSNGVYGSATTLLNVYPGVSQTIIGASQRYVFFVATLDDSTCGGTSTITDISLTYNGAPTIPTLLQPANGATAVSLLPEFRMGSADDSLDYIRYKIEVCSTSNCSSIVRTIDQTASQTGWSSQSQQSGTAYLGGVAITQYAVHKYQTTALTGSTQYWWRAYAIDPGGTNQFSAASSIWSFTTGLAVPNQVNIGGGTSIYGGTTLQP